MRNSVWEYPDTLEIHPVDGPVSATVKLPGSKSITNRAMIVAALADGHSILREALFSDDTRYMSQSLAALGIPVQTNESGKTIEVSGQGGAIPSTNAELFIGNSGTSARFLTALAALGHGIYVVDGVERMRQRPIGPLLEALRYLGADASSFNDSGCPPVTIRASGLKGGEVRMNGDTSSQYFTALLMVAPVTRNGIRISVNGELVSKPYIDMTAATMRDFGVLIEYEDYQSFNVPGMQRYTARDYAIEPDASAASYFFALAAVTGGTIRVANLGKDSAQGDLEFVNTLERMGCQVTRRQDWTEVTGPDSLSGVDVDMNAISDTMPTLAAIAPFADGSVSIRNVEHVRHKETDRIAAVANELRRLGIEVAEQQDGLVIKPGTPKPAVIQTYDDHRIAMSFAVTGCVTSGLTIDDPGCVAKTFPEFFEKIAEVTGR